MTELDENPHGSLEEELLSRIDWIKMQIIMAQKMNEKELTEIFAGLGAMRSIILDWMESNRRTRLDGLK